MEDSMHSYLEALQNFSYILAMEQDNRKIAEELYNEKLISKLEGYLVEKRKQFKDNEWFYYAGMAFERTLNRIYKEDSCDAINAAIGGLATFENVIGITEEEND